MKGIVYSHETGRYHLCPDRGFPALEQQHIAVSNHAKMGATICDALRILERKPPEKDSVVLLEFGGNDCNFDWAEIARQPQKEYQPVVEPGLFAETYTKVIQKAKEFTDHVVICNLIPLDAGKFMNWLSSGKCYENIIKWLGDISVLYRWKEYYNRIVESVAKDTRCPIIDVRAVFLTSRNYPELFCGDGIHPTATGHRLLRRSISEHLLSAYA